MKIEIEFEVTNATCQHCKVTAPLQPKVIHWMLPNDYKAMQFTHPLGWTPNATMPNDLNNGLCPKCTIEWQTVQRAYLEGQPLEALKINTEPKPEAPRAGIHHLQSAMPTSPVAKGQALPVQAAAPRPQTNVQSHGGVRTSVMATPMMVAAPRAHSNASVAGNGPTRMAANPNVAKVTTQLSQPNVQSMTTKTNITAQPSFSAPAPRITQHNAIPQSAKQAQVQVPIPAQTISHTAPLVQQQAVGGGGLALGAGPANPVKDATPFPTDIAWPS